MRKTYYALTILFLTFISVGAFSLGFFNNVETLTHTAVEIAFYPEKYIDHPPNASLKSTTLMEITDTLTESLILKNHMVEYCGLATKLAGVRSYYNNTYGINITQNGYTVKCYEKTSTDYEVEQIISFKEYLDQKGINLLYVSEPAKYIDDDFFYIEFGSESYLNRNTDLFLQRINCAGIDYIDLRENCLEEGIDSLSLFYKTDHHWTVPTSKWAAQIIAEHLNENYGYNIPTEFLYGDAQYTITDYKNVWLGEQGRKIGQSYLGLDDYTLMLPSYETSFTFYKNKNIVMEGSFESFINFDKINTSANPRDAAGWHYIYQVYPNNANHIHNNIAEYGNILLLGDSYENTLAPFLALGIQDIIYKQPRYMDTSIRDFIESNNFDTVIVAYTQFMIGAHDNMENINYSQFTLE